MPRIIYSVSISDEFAEQMKKNNIRPSDAFKRGVMLYLREKTMTDEDNPLILKEKISRMAMIIQNQTQEYELLREQYEKLKTKDL